MSHMVIYRGADGKPGYHQTDDIHDAVMYVESLRNDKDVDHARIFRLEEVTFEYRPYYRVEISAAGAAAAPAVSAVADTNGHSDVVETTEASDDDDAGSDDADDSVEEAVEELSDDVADAADDSSDDAESDSGDDSDDDDAPISGARRGLFGR